MGLSSPVGVGRWSGRGFSRIGSQFLMREKEYSIPLFSLTRFIFFVPNKKILTNLFNNFLDLLM